MARLLEIEELPIRLTADGRWLHGREPVHPRVATLFSRCIVPDADGRGGYHLEVGRDRAPVEVADAAYRVERMRLEERDGALQVVLLELSDGAEEPLDPATLEISDEHVLYTRVARAGLSVPCRFPPALYHRLALFVEERPEGYVLPLRGRDWPLGRHDPSPRPPGPRAPERA